MSEKRTRLGPLQSRKQLLVAESELNRAQLSEEWHATAHGIRGLTHQAKTIAAWAPAVALAVGAVAAWRRRRATGITSKTPWFTRIVDGACMASTMWRAFCARGNKEKQP